MIIFISLKYYKFYKQITTSILDNIWFIVIFSSEMKRTAVTLALGIKDNQWDYRSTSGHRQEIMCDIRGYNQSI